VRLATTIALALLAVAATGCGSLSKDDAEQTVRDFAKATSAADGKKLCHDLVSHDYLEKTTFATGDNAIEQCVKQISAAKGIEVKVSSIKSAKVDGDRATVTAELEYQGTKRPQVFNLKKEDGRFKLVSSPQ
jgi:ketosteroid isomerase-like protein